MVDVCFTDLYESTKDFLTRKEAKQFMDEIKSRAQEKALNKKMDKADALNMSIDELVDEEKKKLEIQKRQAYLNIVLRRKVDDFVGQFGDDKLKGLLAYLDGTQRNVKNGRYSVFARQKSRTQQLFGSLLEKLSTNENLKLFGDPNAEEELAAQLFGSEESKNPKIREIANSIKETYAEGRRLMNKAGSSIGTLPEFIASQIHDSERLENGGLKLKERYQLRKELRKKYDYKEAKQQFLENSYQRWKNYILPRLDQSRTFDQNGVVDREKFLRTTWDNLRTGIHYSKTTDFDGNLPFTRPGNKANKLSASRKLHFKDGKSWFEYNKQFGTGSVHMSIMQTIRAAGKNLGLLEGLGANPEAMLDNLLKKYSKESQPYLKTRVLRNRQWRAKSIFKQLDGSANVPVNNLLAKINQGARAVIFMSRLGQIVASSISDLGINGSLLRDHGVGLNERYGTQLKALFEGKKPQEKKELAALLGVWSEQAFGHIVTRFSAVDNQAGTFSRGMQIFFKLAGMEWWDSTNRTAMGAVLSKHMAMQSEKPWEALTDDQRRNYSLYGIEDNEWNLIRKSRQNFKSIKNEIFVTPDAMQGLDDDSIREYLDKPNANKNEIQDIKDDMQSRLSTYFVDQTDQANIQPSAGDRALLVGMTQPGTMIGEVTRHIGLLKMFSVAFARRVFGRLLLKNLKGDEKFDIRKSDIMGLTELMVATTIMGYIGMNAKMIMKGEEPRFFSNNLEEDGKITLAAMLQGGGLGIFGDFMFGQYNRYGQGFISTLAGPVGGVADQLASLMAALREGDDPTNMAFHLAENNMPFINLWMTRTVMNYLFLWGLQEKISPGSIRRMENNLRKNNDSQYIFSPQQYAIGVT